MENLLNTFESTFGAIGIMAVNVFGALLILFIGWIIARFIKKMLLKLLEKAKLDTLIGHLGIQEPLNKVGLSKFSLSNLIASLVYIIIMLLVILAALNVLKITAVSELFNQIMLFIPNLIVVIILLLVGLYLAKMVAGLISSSDSVKGGTKGVASKIAYYGILTLTVFMCLNQLGIASEIVNTAFTLLLGSVCVGAGLAFGIAFGIGGQHKAKDIVDQLSNNKDD